MTSKQLQRTVFRANASTSGFRASTGRLLRDGYLVRLLEPVPGGEGGGRGQNVYRLGDAGWWLLRKPGAYTRRRSVDYHALAIGDLYLAMLDAQDAGWMKVRYIEIEAEALRTVGGVMVTPDIYVEVVNVERRTVRPFAIEVDRGSEHRPQILDKVRRYREAKRANDYADVYESFPDVIFLAHDRARAEQLKRWIGKDTHVDGDRVFYFGLLDSFPGALRTP